MYYFRTVLLRPPRRLVQNGVGRKNMMQRTSLRNVSAFIPQNDDEQTPKTKKTHSLGAGRLGKRRILLAQPRSDCANIPYPNPNGTANKRARQSNAAKLDDSREALHYRKSSRELPRKNTPQNQLPRHPPERPSPKNLTPAKNDGFLMGFD